MAKLTTTAQPRPPTAQQYEAACALLLKANAAALALKAENAQLRSELRTMRATQRTVKIFETFDPPSTLEACVAEKRRRGLL